MWKLSPYDLSQLKGAGGERFAHFVDRLIRGEAAHGGLPQSEIETQLRVNIPDGGVDTCVKQPIPRDQSGWFDVPTCWQFKSADAREINDKSYKKKRNELQEEIHKPYVEELIKGGFAYRFCLLGDLTPQKAKAWEDLLAVEARAINPNAPQPRVVHGGLLLYWAEQFPGVIAWLRHLSQGVFHWEAWRDNCRAVTPIYVENPEWERIQSQIAQHADFDSLPIGGVPCLAIGGAAGVGKTRLVFETLNQSAAAPSLVVYAADEQEARAVATSVANTPSQTAILVADECTPSTRHFLNENLRAYIQRLRVICLDNTGERLATFPSQVWLSAESLKNTDAILEANFQNIPPDRRHQYAQLSRGFVRLAADMCKHDAELKSGDMSQLPSSVEQYVRLRLKAEHLPLISLLALFHKVGFREDVKGDMESLCKISGSSPQVFRKAIQVVRESPGFVVQAGRYWYVTPEIVSRVLFAEGWAQWIVDDIANFFGSLPAQFHQQVIDRAGRFGNPEVRDRLARFFRRWFNDLTSDGLANPDVATLACSLVETNPDQYLPLLRSIIENASSDSLLRIEGHAPGAKWGPRRTLVWLLENLISLPECFNDAEACLFRLAMHETEPQIGNNATRIWQELFSIYLSGTATPFSSRIAILRDRTRTENLEEAKVAFRGVARAFQKVGSKVVGQPIVAGRLRPPHWEPATAQEEFACYQAALSLCEEHISHGNGDHHRELAFDVLTNSLFFLISKGFLVELKRILVPSQLNESETRKLLNKVDRYIEVRTETHSATPDHINDVQQWISSFRPTDFDGRLRSICGREPWDRRFANDINCGRDETNELADVILAQPLRLEPHLDWLATKEARATERLAFALGRADEQFVCAEMVFGQALRSQTPSLLRGYVRGLVFAGWAPTQKVFQLMAEIEAAYPELAVDVLSFAGDAFDGLNRIIELVDSGKISPRYLATLATGIGRRELSAEEVSCLLPYFVEAARKGDKTSVEAGVRFLSTYLRSEHRHTKESCLQAEQTKGHAWNLTETAIPFVDSQLSYEWIEIFDKLSEFDVQRSTKLLTQALRSESDDLATEAEERLIALAPKQPELVMESFGEALLDRKTGWRLQFGLFRDLVTVLPPDCVLSWVRQHGSIAALAIARHLPLPYLDGSGKPVVPELLDRFLQEYEDEEVFNTFLAGSHSRESWWGDASERFRHEADEAKKFLNHSNQNIRKWAKREIADRQHMAEWEEQRQSERFLPS